MLSVRRIHQILLFLAGYVAGSLVFLGTAVSVLRHCCAVPLSLGRRDPLSQANRSVAFQTTRYTLGWPYSVPVPGRWNTVGT